jgi:Spy/CpxP family protein refolding chaperone
MKNLSPKTLSISIIVLLLINLGLVTFLVLERTWLSKGRSKRPDTLELFAKEVGITDSQRVKIKELRETYFTSIRPIMDSMRILKTEFYEKVKLDAPVDTAFAAYETKFNNWQMQINKQTYEHFRTVRDLLTPAQQPKFDEFVQKMMQRSRRDSSRRK